jgi:hypothetical protein
MFSFKRKEKEKENSSLKFYFLKKGTRRKISSSISFETKEIYWDQKNYFFGGEFFHHFVKKNWKINISHKFSFNGSFLEKSIFLFLKMTLNCHNLLTMKRCLRFFFTFIF